jgi:hypothetical protein
MPQMRSPSEKRPKARQGKPMRCNAMRCDAMQCKARQGVDHAASHFEEIRPLPLPWAFPYSIELHFSKQNKTKHKNRETRKPEG